jgi:multidrug resistance efflux pump
MKKLALRTSLSTLTNMTDRGKSLALKLAFSIVVGLVLLGQFSQAVTSKIIDSKAATVLPARIRAARLFSIAAGVPGSIASVSVIPGDKVSAGQELALLESPEIRFALERAAKRLDRAKERLDSGFGNNGRSRIYSEQYHAAQAAWKTACDRADGVDITPQERMYAHHSGRFKAMEKLAVHHLVTTAEIERSRREEQDALQNLKSAREHQSRLAQECDACLAQMRVAKLQLDLHRNDDLDVTKAEYEAALAEVNTLAEQEKRMRIVSLRPATVLAALVGPGDRVAAGAPLFQMGDVADLSVEVSVDAAIAKNVNKGDRVTVRLPTQPPRQVDAAVSSVILAPGDDTRSYVVRVVIANPDPRTILAGLEGAVAFRHTGWGSIWEKLPF